MRSKRCDESWIAGQSHGKEGQGQQTRHRKGSDSVFSVLARAETADTACRRSQLVSERKIGDFTLEFFMTHTSYVVSNCCVYPDAKMDPAPTPELPAFKSENGLSKTRPAMEGSPVMPSNSEISKRRVISDVWRSWHLQSLKHQNLTFLMLLVNHCQQDGLHAVGQLKHPWSDPTNLRLPHAGQGATKKPKMSCRNMFQNSICPAVLHFQKENLSSPELSANACDTIGFSKMIHHNCQVISLIVAKA